ncbi:hypothetical protein EI42_06126 [Thermosporothrix hazakensis]|uniref:Uncharacterized protein n=1 Tax=Thermosporothrix hazakensis TaxID=644383 RepID=A0A326U259_THEHA|nr:hypothetical protein [Thermosporothrix hazakensis]PZW19313.1 hypothetical protein EI42_06126 [Thermosporothrix hazakensis]GCE48248.1 hypothetical protein KTH_31170 [Thermosporothrix hazakensis]
MGKRVKACKAKKESFVSSAAFGWFLCVCGCGRVAVCPHCVGKEIDGVRVWWCSEAVVICPHCVLTNVEGAYLQLCQEAVQEWGLGLVDWGEHEIRVVEGGSRIVGHVVAMDRKRGYGIALVQGVYVHFFKTYDGDGYYLLTDDSRDVVRQMGVESF